MAEGDQTTVGAGSEGSSGPPANPAASTGEDAEGALTPMELQLETVSMERDDYRRKLETIEAELAALTAASPDADTINKLQQDNDHLRKTLKKATDMLREKITYCNIQEKKNQALTTQVITLKDVLQVTRDLLNIRNIEVEQLQKNVDSMETKIDENRRRQTAMIKQMEQATKINGELRNEYETQLRIFQSLKERYEEKVTALTNLAYERQRHNSEGSEKFEDAPDGIETVNSSDGDVSGAVNELGAENNQDVGEEQESEINQQAAKESEAENTQDKGKQESEISQTAAKKSEAENTQDEGKQEFENTVKVEKKSEAESKQEVANAPEARIQDSQEAESTLETKPASQSSDPKESLSASATPAAVLNDNEL